MSTTYAPMGYRVSGPAQIVKQKISLIEMSPRTMVGEVRSIPSGVDTAAANRRFRSTAGKELPVDLETTAGRSEPQGASS